MSACFFACEESCYSRILHIFSAHCDLLHQKFIKSVSLTPPTANTLVRLPIYWPNKPQCLPWWTSEGVQRNYRVNIIIRLLKHVSAAPLSVLSACGILRGTVQSVALYFVHGCSVSLLAGALRVKPGARSPSAAVTGGGTITFSVPCQPSEPKTRLWPSLWLP